MRFGIDARLWSGGWSDADLDLTPYARDLGYAALEIPVSNLAQINEAGMEFVATLALVKERALPTPDPAVRRQGIACPQAAVETRLRSLLSGARCSPGLTN